MRSESQDVRQHILDTGEAIILGKGFSAVGLAEILSAAGVPKGSFYYYFASKEAFGEALVDHYFTAYLAAQAERLGAPGVSARERLLGYWQHWYATQTEGRCHEQCLVVKLSAEVSDLSESMRAALLRGTDQVIAALAACTAAGVADGSLPADLDPAHTAQSLYQLWLGASLLTKVRRDASALDTALALTRRTLGVEGGGSAPRPALSA